VQVNAKKHKGSIKVTQEAVMKHIRISEHYKTMSFEEMNE